MPSSLRRILTLVNPHAGTDSLFLDQLAKVTSQQKIGHEIVVTQSIADVAMYIQRAIADKVDAVAVYGGDGTVVEAARHLYCSSVPLIILPGGTANVIAKELGIPTDLKKALRIFKHKPTLKKIDVAKVGSEPVFLRIEVGVVAGMVQAAKKSGKDTLGILSYPLAAIKNFATAKTATYSLTLDGKKRTVEGIGLMIANVGNIGLPGISVQQKVSCEDGLLDVFVLTSADLQTLLAVGKSAVMGTDKPAELKYWQAKRVQLKVSPKQPMISDDRVLKEKTLTIRMTTQKLHVLV